MSGALMPTHGSAPVPATAQVAAVRGLSSLITSAPAYGQIDPARRADLDHSLAVIQSFLDPHPGAHDDAPGSAFARAPGGALALAEGPIFAHQMAPDLRARLSPGGEGGGDGGWGSQGGPRPGTTSGPGAAGAGAAGGQTSGGAGSGSAVGRVGEATRATLNAINFPDFVASLVQGTFQAIVDASIQQMEAYAEMLKNVASTVDRFMSDNISEDTARDHLADQYGGVFGRAAGPGGARLVVNQNTDEMPSFLRDLGFDSPQQLDDQSINDVVVPAVRRNLAERRQQTLATMVLMGINRVVVRDGEINAKLMFHIDASETTGLTFNQQQVGNGNMSGYAGRRPFGASGLMVNTTSVNAQSALNVRADLTGQVTVRFASETFPLERFADSAAIQLISSNAKVPQAPAPAAVSAPQAPGAMPGAAPGAAPPNPAAGRPNAPPGLPPPGLPATPAPAAPRPATQQSVALGAAPEAAGTRPNKQDLADDPSDDPWAPSSAGAAHA